MPQLQEPSSDASITADPVLPIIHTVCDFDATPTEVMRAHTDAALFSQWIGAATVTARVDQWDCRTLGSYRYSYDRVGESHAFRGTFAEVGEDRIVLTFAEEAMPRAVSLESITLEDLDGGGTRLRVQSLCHSFEARDAMLVGRMRAGGESYAELGRMLAVGASVPDSPAERHRRFARTFTHRVEGVRDWSVPTPVTGWAALDIVGHLVSWLPGFLAAFTSITLPVGPSVDEDPAAAWRHHSGAVQDLLDDPETAEAPCATPMFGEQGLAEVIDRIYTADVFMHTWDLAVATGQDTRLNQVFCAQLLDGMLPLDQVLRDSGQYGPRVDVPAGAGVQERLLGFIGRDPAWRP